jgi:uroporphyrinogen decarboxylase
MAKKESILVRAAKGRKTERTPVWFMRQAGRYLPQYRALRRGRSIAAIYKSPSLSSAITTLPVKLLGVDAAIVFADIMTPLEAMGVSFTLGHGGPVVNNPIKDKAGLDALRQIDPYRDTGYVMETIRRSKKSIGDAAAIVGFAGAPFTLASYMIEGSLTRDLVRLKGFMHSEQELWPGLMATLVRSISSYARAQVESGAEAIQIFDSWAGVLGPEDYDEYALPYLKRLFAELRKTGAATIYFSTGTSGMLEMLKEVGADTISVDWRIGIADAWARLGRVSVQGNLDPTLMLCDFQVIRKRALGILDGAAGRPGHIFNLGHGMLPNTPIGNAARLVKMVHETTET